MRQACEAPGGSGWPPHDLLSPRRGVGPLGVPRCTTRKLSGSGAPPATRGSLLRPRASAASNPSRRSRTADPTRHQGNSRSRARGSHAASTLFPAATRLASRSRIHRGNRSGSAWRTVRWTRIHGPPPPRGGHGLAAGRDRGASKCRSASLRVKLSSSAGPLSEADAGRKSSAPPTHSTGSAIERQALDSRTG